MEPCKGLFWWTGERLLCVQFPCGADGNTPGGRRSPGGLKQPSLGLGQAAQGRHTGESL